MQQELKRILVVDDDARDLELTLAALEESNLANEIVTARDGVEAMEYLNRTGPHQNRPSGNPAVVLLDLKMPRLDGFDVLRQIRSDENLRTIPVVVLTSSREERDLVETYKLGVNGYVIKPVDFHEFHDAVRQLGVFWALVNEPPPGSVGKSS